MKKQSYFQGTADPNDKPKPEKLPMERIDMDVRHPNVFTCFKNYDYTYQGADDTSPGGGLYHGPMDRFKSVKDFLETRRKELNNRKERAQKRAILLNSLVTKVS